MRVSRVRPPNGWTARAGAGWAVVYEHAQSMGARLPFGQRRPARAGSLIHILSQTLLLMGWMRRIQTQPCLKRIAGGAPPAAFPFFTPEVYVTRETKALQRCSVFSLPFHFVAVVVRGHINITRMHCTKGTASPDRDTNTECELGGATEEDEQIARGNKHRNTRHSPGFTLYHTMKYVNGRIARVCHDRKNIVRYVTRSTKKGLPGSCAG